MKYFDFFDDLTVLLLKAPAALKVPRGRLRNRPAQRPPTIAPPSSVSSDRLKIAIAASLFLLVLTIAVWPRSHDEAAAVPAPFSVDEDPEDSDSTTDFATDESDDGTPLLPYPFPPSRPSPAPETSSPERSPDAVADPGSPPENSPLPAPVPDPEPEPDRGNSEDDAETGSRDGQGG